METFKDFIKDLVTSLIPEKHRKMAGAVFRYFTGACGVLAFVGCCLIIAWNSGAFSGGSSLNSSFESHPKNFSVNGTTHGEEEYTLNWDSGLSPDSAVTPDTSNSTRVISTVSEGAQATLPSLPGWVEFPTRGGYDVPSQSAVQPSYTGSATTKSGNIVPKEAQHTSSPPFIDASLDSALKAANYRTTKGRHLISTTQPPTAPPPSTESLVEEYADNVWESEAGKTSASENSLKVETICPMTAQSLSYPCHEEPSDSTSIENHSIPAADEHEASVMCLCQAYLKECRKPTPFRNDVYCSDQENEIIATYDHGKLASLINMKTKDEEYSNETELHE